MKINHYKLKICLSIYIRRKQYIFSMLCTFADIILYPVQIKIKNMYVIFKKKIVVIYWLIMFFEFFVISQLYKIEIKKKK